MNSKETTDLDYLSEVFRGLSMANRDYLLQTARSLIKTQNNEIRLQKKENNALLADASLPKSEDGNKGLA